MEKFVILKDLEISIDRDSALSAIDCHKDSPVYADFCEEFDSILPEIKKMAQPCGILGTGTLTELSATKEYPPGTKVIYAVLSIGDKISQYSTNCFNEGEYVKGMLSDAMADCALFSLEGRMLEQLKDFCGTLGTGIISRLEAPHDISMEVQKEAHNALALDERLGIGITSGYMLDPVKTSCQVFIISEDTTKFSVRHDCRKCPNTKCKFRNEYCAEIAVVQGDGTKYFLLKENESLMDGLIREGFYINAVCGGKGRCGKCKVQLISGNALPSGEDKSFFTQSELDKGYRLSCTLFPDEDITISLGADESDFDILSISSDSVTQVKCDAYDIAIDIGTTTIAMSLIGNSQPCHSVTLINRQRRYGADVVSRIKASCEGKGQELRESIKTDLANGITRLCNEYGIGTESIKTIAISANTTMGHLLMGFDCSSLGKYPFTPVNISEIKDSAKNIIGLDMNAEVVLLPGISTYVGADIVSGLYECGFDKSEDICLLVDLGTNGEMALGNKDKILVTSTAAGPAFEGGNISCGTGSVEGAICSVEVADGNVSIKTIKDKSPVGICGTGVIETVAQLLKNDIIDETGLLDEEYFDDGFPLAHTDKGEIISFTQKDVRELQLAKAAVLAGIQTLLVRYGISADEVKKVYLAGGFGYKLNTANAAAIGMLPSEFTERTVAVGNSSLAGAVKYLNCNGDTALQNLIDKSEEISLSADKDFNDFYMDAMMFE